MPFKPSQALLAALAVIAAPAFAQDGAPAAAEPPAAQSSGAQAPAAEAPADQAPAASDAPAAAGGAATPAETAPAANAEPQVGQYYVKETHQDWSTRCLRIDEGKDPCELYQLLEDSDGNPVAEMTLIPLRNSAEIAAGATLVAPLETDLVQGLGFAVGTAEPRGYPFNFCAPAGCVSRMGFTQAELDALKRGATATVTLLPFGGDRENPVRLTLSLAGFTAAYNALTAYANEPAPAEEAPSQTPAAETPAAQTPAD